MPDRRDTLLGFAMTRTHRPDILLFASALLAGACGGGSPSGPSTPAQTYSVVVTAFYDVNNNGVLDPGENNRVPGVTLEVGGRTGTTVPLTGQARVDGVPAGTYTVRHTGALPAYYQPSGPAAPALTVPQASGAEHAVPFTLPLGSTPPYTYMAFGDSLTLGDGSSDGNGYRNRLREKLQAHFGLAYVINEGISGTQSDVGAQRIGPLIDRNLPAYTLILYGVNDWNDRYCREEPPCFTIDSLRSMIREVRSVNGLPILSTIPPANEGISDRVPPERNIFVRDMNERIKALGREERVPVADPYRLFAARTPLSSLFVDHVHPTDEGYEMIAQAFFEAISQPLATGSSSALGSVSFRPTRR